ncbi:amidohydrolase [Anaerovorax odorimutans]|uniref:Amidohydrolase n=1 Tax=Anaerovorax odorimutans TaxID=109327 RepID=A0ABT1RNF7_9FIRM|nr:amidohydrolase [Anaerovorax odorimutans]MCQ4636724.1 amidohydrolase [Anaerovorax odorimutans]
MKADLVVKNGRIFDGGKSLGNTAAAVKDGKFVFVGKDAAVETYIGEDTKIIDAAECSILPGFVDAHLHATMCTELYATKLIYGIDRQEGESRRAYIERNLEPVREYAEENPDLPIIRATGWTPAAFQLDPEGTPTCHEIDELVCADRPVMLRSFDHHSVLVNSKALEMAGITKDTPTPRNGMMSRDADGNPTGLFQELSAICMLIDKLPLIDFSVEEYKAGILNFQKEQAFPHGLMGIFDAYATENALAAYKELAESGELKIRVRTALLADLSRPFDQFEQMVKDKGKYDVGDDFKIETVKFFCDGGGFTFYMNEPFEAQVLKEMGYPPEYRGFPQWTEEEMKQAFLLLAKGGYQIHVHAMGDAAVKQTLNAYEYIEENGVRGRRNSIAHIMNIDDGDIERMARLNVVGSIQPTWPIIDYFSMMFVLPLLGRERMYNQYPIGRMKKAGAVMASGTDFPITVEIDPLKGIQVGMTRTTPKESEHYEEYKGIISGPEDDPTADLMSLNDMIESYTLSGAYQMFTEDVTGTIEAGKSADFVILSGAIEDAEPMDIGEMKVDKFILKGEQVK